MGVNPERRTTAAEYLAFERQAQERHEFVDEIVYAMSGGTREHGLVSGNAVRHVGNLLRDRPCEVYGGNVRVKVRETGDYVYPDVVIACGDIQFEDTESDTLLTPLVVVEVLSPSTEAYDRGKKASLYRQIPSLQHYVLIAQDRVSVEVFTRTDALWVLTEAVRMEDSVRLDAIGCDLALAEVYAKVQFPSADAAIIDSEAAG